MSVLTDLRNQSKNPQKKTNVNYMDPLQAKAELDIQERVKILPQEITDLILDGSLDAVVYDLQETYSLSKVQVKLLENEIILVLTLFLSPNSFVDNVEESLEIDRVTAEAIGVKVREELFSLIDDIIASVENARKDIQTSIGDENLLSKMEKREELKNLAQTFAQPATTSIPTPPNTNAPTTAETYIEKVEPIRTMEGDINRIHGYGTQMQNEEDAKKTTLENIQ